MYLLLYRLYGWAVAYLIVCYYYIGVFQLHQKRIDRNFVHVVMVIILINFEKRCWVYFATVM